MPNDKPRVLVVDDDPVLVKMLSLTLPPEGVVVECAMSGAQALEMLAHKTYDVILLDLRMQPMTGAEFLDLYKGTVPVVIMTGNADEALKSFAGHPNVLALLHKPRSVKPFVAAIRHALFGSEPALFEDEEVPPVHV